MFEANGVGAVSYENLRIDISTTNFIEDGAVPKDAEIVSRTWKFVNKKAAQTGVSRTTENCLLCAMRRFSFRATPAYSSASRSPA